MNEPLGIVEGDGIVGKNIPAYTVRLSNGEISAIPKEEARLISKQPEPIASVIKEPVNPLVFEYQPGYKGLIVE